MCELFGMTAARDFDVRDLLEEFYSHSLRHPHGWGLALLYPEAAGLEKEPVPAARSAYLQQRLSTSVCARNCIAHIRLATRGKLDYANTHPFVRRDGWGRTWTLAHNGTLFQNPLTQYCKAQQGETDSERILLALIDRVDACQARQGRALTAQERFTVVDGLVCDLAPHNKLNLLIYDGELFYAHTNMQGTLYRSCCRERTLFATVPLGYLSWETMTFTTLTAWQNGTLRFTGTNHRQEYQVSQNDVQFLIHDSAML